jgi:hypothetical protein
MAGWEQRGKPAEVSSKQEMMSRRWCMVRLD